MNEKKVGNFTNGGSDTRDGGHVPQGSDTKPFYTRERTPETGTFAHGTESESGEIAYQRERRKAKP